MISLFVYVSPVYIILLNMAFYISVYPAGCCPDSRVITLLKGGTAMRRLTFEPATSHHKPSFIPPKQHLLLELILVQGVARHTETANSPFPSLSLARFFFSPSLSPVVFSFPSFPFSHSTLSSKFPSHLPFRLALSRVTVTSTKHNIYIIGGRREASCFQIDQSLFKQF